VQLRRSEDLAEVDERALDVGESEASAANDVVAGKWGLVDPYPGQPVSRSRRNRDLDALLIEPEGQDSGGCEVAQRTQRERSERGLGTQLERVGRGRRRVHPLVESAPRTVGDSPSSLGTGDAELTEQWIGEDAPMGEGVLGNSSFVHQRLLMFDRHQGKTDDRTHDR